MKLSNIKPNPDNPRVIKDLAFEKLCQSIKDFPKMLELRPMVTDENGVVLGRNMQKQLLDLTEYITLLIGNNSKRNDQKGNN